MTPIMLSRLRTVLLCLVAVAATLPLSSCRKLKEAEKGAATPVRISVSLPQPLKTKAFNDGKSATDLHFRAYRVVEGGAEYLPGLSQDISNAFDASLKAEISTSVLSGYTYHFVFWAQSPNAVGTYDLSSLDSTQPYVGVDYSTMVNSDERMDAFTVTKLNYSVSVDGDLSLVLTRPLAQLNFGTTDADWTDAANSGVQIDITSCAFKDAYTRYYPLSGGVSHPVNVTFASAFIPDETLVVDNNPYHWLSMNYILVPVGKTLTDVSMELKMGDRHIHDVAVPNVPVQRNYRTNTLGGRLITSSTTISIILDPVFTDDYDLDAF